MNATNAIMALSAIVTALSALGAFRYVRQAARDAAWSRRALEGEANRSGLIETVAANRQRSRQNELALRRAELRTDGGDRDE